MIYKFPIIPISNKLLTSFDNHYLSRARNSTVQSNDTLDHLILSIGRLLKRGMKSISATFNSYTVLTYPKSLDTYCKI